MVFAESMSIIFLDIDGVLMPDRFVNPLNRMIREKLVHLFGERSYTELEWRIAQSYFLSRPAIQNLESLIERLSRVAPVGIVLSSAWRLDGTLEQIRDQMFVNESFSRWIIDKIPDDDWWRITKGEKPLSLRGRAQQIEYWLLENVSTWDVSHFVILDDVDEGLSERFPGQFIRIDDLLSEGDIEKVYEVLNFERIRTVFPSNANAR